MIFVYDSLSCMISHIWNNIYDFHEYDHISRSYMILPYMFSYIIIYQESYMILVYDCHI